MYLVESKGGGIACMLLALFFFSTYLAVMAILDKQPPLSTYLPGSFNNKSLECCDHHITSDWIQIANLLCKTFSSSIAKDFWPSVMFAMTGRIASSCKSSQSSKAKPNSLDYDFKDIFKFPNSGLKARECRQQNLTKVHAEHMDEATSNGILHPRGHGIPRRSYVPPKTCKVKFLPPADAIKLISGTQMRCHYEVVKKHNTLETGEAHQESIETSKPLGICLKGSEPCSPNSDLKPSLNDHGVSVDPDQKSGFGEDKQKGQEMALSKKAELGVSKQKGKNVSFLCATFPQGLIAGEYRQQTKEIMAKAPSNDVLHPRGAEVPRRSYVPPKTCKVKLIPPAEAVKLMSGTQVGCCRNIVKKSNTLETGKANQESMETSKPLRICLKGPGSGLLNSNLNPSVNDHGGSVDFDRTAGFEIGKGKGQEIALTGKRKLAPGDCANSAKIAHTVAEGCSS